MKKLINYFFAKKEEDVFLKKEKEVESLVYEFLKKTIPPFEKQMFLK